MPIEMHGAPSGSVDIFVSNIGFDDNPYMTGHHGQDQDTLDFDCQATQEYSNLFGGGIPAESPSDWTFSPPAWQGSLYTVTPPSSAGVSPNSPWNPFEQSFASIQTSIDIGAFVSSGTSHFSAPATSCQAPYSSNPQGGTYSYVSPAAVNRTATFNKTDEEGSTATLQAHDNAHLPSQKPNFSSSQPVYGAARPRRHDLISSSSASHSSSKTVTTSKRRNALKQEPRSIANSSKSDPSPSLRLKKPSRPTSFSSASSSGSNASSETKTRKESRTCHNDVEKQYRNRLNNHFETLLQTLPKDGGRDGEKKVSKAEVLVLAKRHIHHLEREKRMLEKERAEMEVSVEEMRRKWLGLGGVCLP